MDYQQLRDEIAALPPEERIPANNAFMRTSIGGTMLPGLDEILAQSRNHTDFFARIYEDEALLGQSSWIGVSKVFFPQWPQRMKPRTFLVGVPVEGETYELEAVDGNNLLIPLPANNGTVDIYFFDDKVLPQKELTKVGVVMGTYRFNGQQNGECLAVFSQGTNIFLIDVTLDRACRLSSNCAKCQ